MQLACPKGQFSQLGSLMFGTPDRLLRLAWDRSNDPANEFGALQLSFFFVVYCVLASASFLGAFPGGFFIPAILIGAMFGRLFARLVNYMFFPYYSLQLGVYATLGSVSMLASVNRVTLPIVAMMVEFTSDVQFLTPIMIIILFAKFIADFFCLGLEPEVGKLQPRITMALGEAASPVMGHVNAKDVLSVNSMIQGYPSFCLNDELYPGHSDLAVVGEIDSVHRLQALLETTTHSAFPVVSVLPSNITTCTHLQGLAQRVYQRSILKSLHLDQKSPNGLSMRTMSSLPNSASLVSSLSSLGNNWNASSLGSFLTPEMKAKQDQMAATLQSLQPYHDDLFAQCPCQNFQAGHGKFVGLITRRSLRTLIEKSVDYTRATRIINSGNHSRLFRGASSAELGGGDAASTLTNSSIPENQAADNTEQIKKETAEHQTWYQKLTSKFSKSGNITDTPGSVDSVTAQIDANKRSEQLDLVSEDGVTQKSSKKNRLGQFSQQVQHNSVKCQCLTCTTHRWALVRYHTPLLALFQHQNTKKRVFPLLANIYFQTGIYLKSIYKQSYQHLIQLSPQFQQQLQNSNVPNHLLSICHPVLVHRELLSTAINFISSLIKLPKLPQHLQDTIFRLAQMKSEKIDDNENDGLDESMTGPSLLAARKRQQQHNATLGNRGTVAAAAVAAAASTTTTTTTAPAPVPVAQLVRQTNNDDAFDTDMLFIPSFIRFVTWLEERSQIRYSLNKEHITKHKDNTNDVSLSLTNRTLNNDAHTNGISASTLCVSLVNTLPLSDTGVYVASHMTTGARLWRLFRTAGMAKIVIVNDAHEPVGIITRKDIVRADRYLTSQLNGFKTKLKK
jgi:CBS domain-containing protein